MKLLGMLERDSPQPFPELEAILSQMITAPITTKYMTLAVRFEAFRTILELECNETLQNMALNELMNYVQSMDLNYRYVALGILSRCRKVDSNFVKKNQVPFSWLAADSDRDIQK